MSSQVSIDKTIIGNQCVPAASIITQPQCSRYGRGNGGTALGRGEGKLRRSQGREHRAEHLPAGLPGSVPQMSLRSLVCEATP